MREWIKLATHDGVMSIMLRPAEVACIKGYKDGGCAVYLRGGAYIETCESYDAVQRLLADAELQK